jgi:hypothetical protein
VLFLLLTGAYLIYPTGLWLRGGISLDPASGTYIPAVFYAHGIFILVFMAAFLWISRNSPWDGPRIDTHGLPSSFWVLAVPLAFLFAVAAARAATTGTLLPSNTYSDRWLDLTTSLESARSAGGFSYLVTQVASKFALLPNFALGIGFGLVIAKAYQNRNGRWRLILASLAVAALVQFLGLASRSGALIVVLVAVFLADLLTGLVRWRHVLALGSALLLIFVFFGYFRNVENQGLATGVSYVFRQVATPGGQDLAVSEFELMLVKDTTGARIFENQNGGLAYVVGSIDNLVPSQLLPSKLDQETTASALARELLGAGAVESGHGVANSTIAAGFRIGGLWGITVEAVLAGLLFGGVARWLRRPRAGNHQRPELLRLSLAAVFLASSFEFVRGEFGTSLGLVFYTLVLPWAVLNLLLSGRAKRAWLSPLPLLGDPP